MMAENQLWKADFPAMQIFFKKTILLGLIGVLSACNVSQTTPVPATSTAPVPESSNLSENDAATLASLKQVDDYPLYTMQYYGEYASRRTSGLPAAKQAVSTPNWACSLFTVLLDEEHLLYGRNYDWTFSPALLVFTDPPDGYASVSMVDMEYLGFSGQSSFNLSELSSDDLEGLLDAPLIPFDGMNEHGLTIGMAAVSPGDMQADPAKETIGSLGIIREMLDHARDVDEAVAILISYNIDFEGGPPLHYLIADAKGNSVLVEFYRGELKLIQNEQPWHSATNFLRSSVKDPQAGNCWRYNKINARLVEAQGRLDSKSAMELLAEVAQENTQWSVVYQMARGEVSIAMGRNYSQIHYFQMADYLHLK
jgi:hypothetical protein